MVLMIKAADPTIQEKLSYVTNTLPYQCFAFSHLYAETSKQNPVQAIAIHFLCPGLRGFFKLRK